MRYEANRGGHAPGHLREAFEDYLELENPFNQPYSLTKKVVVADWGKEKKVSLNWLLGQLWNCTDTLPGDCCSILDIPPGSSFAQAVRDLKASI